MDAKIIIALKRKQPQTKSELIKSGIGRSSFYRNIPILINLEIIKKTDKGYAFWEYIEQPNYWTKVKNKFAEAGGHEVDLTIKKASDAGRDTVTGHYQFNHLTEETIKGIIVLRSSVELVTLAESFKIYLRDKYEDREFAGVVLTQDSISFMDRFSWKNELYKIWDTEDRDDGYNFSFRIGYLEWLPK